MMTSSNGNIFRVTGHLCGEFTGPGEFPTQRPVTRSFDVFFDLRLNKRLSKQPWGWWFETPSGSLWRHCNVYTNLSTTRKCLMLTPTLGPRQNGHSFADDHFKRIYWMKLLEFRIIFQWSFFPRVGLTIFQQWFSQWLGTNQAPSHYLNQCWLDNRRIYASPVNSLYKGHWRRPLMFSLFCAWKNDWVNNG